MTNACTQYFLLTVTNRFAFAGNHIIDIIARFVLMHSDRAAGMYFGMDYFSLLIHKHFSAHHSCAAVHPRYGYFLELIKVYKHILFPLLLKRAVPFRTARFSVRYAIFLPLHTFLHQMM